MGKKYKEIGRYLLDKQNTFKKCIKMEKLCMKIHASILILASLYFYITGKILAILWRYSHLSVMGTNLSSRGTLCYYIYDNIDTIIHCDMPVILLLLAFLAIILAKWGKMLLVCNLFFAILNLFLLSLIIGEVSELLSKEGGILGYYSDILWLYCW